MERVLIMTRRLWLLVPAVVLLASLGGGCARALEMRDDVSPGSCGADPATVEKAARQILTDMRFTVIYPASRPYRVETEWLTGDSWFEFWRDDTVGDFQIAESSLHTIRRRVIIDIKAAGQGSEVSVKVLKVRGSAPDLAPQNVSAAFSIYTPQATDLVVRDELGKSAFRWMPMKNDSLLEQRLLDRIRVAAGAGAAAQ
jgi:hypothetical protein